MKLTTYQTELLNNNSANKILLRVSYGGGKTFIGLSKCIDKLIRYNQDVCFITIDYNMIKHSIIQCIDILNELNIKYKVSRSTGEIFINHNRIIFYTFNQMLRATGIIPFMIVIDNLEVLKIKQLDELITRSFLRLRQRIPLPYYKYDFLPNQLILLTSPTFDNEAEYYFKNKFVLNRKLSDRLIIGNLNEAFFLPDTFINDLKHQMNISETFIKGEFNK